MLATATSCGDSGTPNAGKQERSSDVTERRSPQSSVTCPDGGMPAFAREAAHDRGLTKTTSNSDAATSPSWWTSLWSEHASGARPMHDLLSTVSMPYVRGLSGRRRAANMVNRWHRPKPTGEGHPKRSLQERRTTSVGPPRFSRNPAAFWANPAAELAVQHRPSSSPRTLIP
jgi:hypothetical protein